MVRNGIDSFFLPSDHPKHALTESQSAPSVRIVCVFTRVTVSEFKIDLQRNLQTARETLIWKLDGAFDYDVRKPLVPTGTNLLGPVKHAAIVESGYLGEVFDRRFAETVS